MKNTIITILVIIIILETIFIISIENINKMFDYEIHDSSPSLKVEVEGEATEVDSVFVDSVETDSVEIFWVDLDNKIESFSDTIDSIIDSIYYFLLTDSSKFLLKYTKTMSDTTCNLLQAKNNQKKIAKFLQHPYNNISDVKLFYSFLDSYTIYVINQFDTLLMTEMVIPWLKPDNYGFDKISNMSDVDRIFKSGPWRIQLIVVKNSLNFYFDTVNEYNKDFTEISYLLIESLLENIKKKLNLLHFENKFERYYYEKHLQFIINEVTKYKPKILKGYFYEY